MPKPTLYTITRAVSRGTNLQKKWNMFWIPKKQGFNIHQICLCTVKSTGIVISWFFGSKSRISNFHKKIFFSQIDHLSLSKNRIGKILSNQPEFRLKGELSGFKWNIPSDREYLKTYKSPFCLFCNLMDHFLKNCLFYNYL